MLVYSLGRRSEGAKERRSRRASQAVRQLAMSVMQRGGKKGVRPSRFALLYSTRTLTLEEGGLAGVRVAGAWENGE